jgi:hypothetical protein
MRVLFDHHTDNGRACIGANMASGVGYFLGIQDGDGAGVLTELSTLDPVYSEGV